MPTIETLLSQCSPLPITGVQPDYFRGLLDHNRAFLTRTVCDGSMIFLEVGFVRIPPKGSSIESILKSGEAEVMILSRFGLN